MVNADNLNRPEDQHFLEERQLTFDMSWFISQETEGGNDGLTWDPTQIQMQTIGCGTAGLGYLAGIGDTKVEDWITYTYETYLGIHRPIGMDESCLFDFVFGSEWADADNTPLSAAHRARYLALNGDTPQSWKDEWFSDETNLSVFRKFAEFRIL